MLLSVAAGFAFPQQEESVENAFIRADARMYAHKGRIS